MEHAKHVAEYTPFLCMVAGGNDPSSGTKNIIMKLLEAAIIGGIIMYGTVQVIEVRMDYIEKAQQEAKDDRKGIKIMVFDLIKRVADIGK